MSVCTTVAVQNILCVSSRGEEGVACNARDSKPTACCRYGTSVRSSKRLSLRGTYLKQTQTVLNGSLGQLHPVEDGAKDERR